MRIVQQALVVVFASVMSLIVVNLTPTLSPVVEAPSVPSLQTVLEDVAASL